MVDLNSLEARGEPFEHWVADDFVDADTVRAINAQWPKDGAEGWRVETGVATTSKGSMLFPRRLPDAAQALAESLCSKESMAHLSGLVGLELLADPWMHEGPTTPALGGGLHEIHRGGLLKIHVDFEKHPIGLRRVVNLLVYLNEDWQEEWGGELELHGNTIERIVPMGARAVLFVTGPDSWHGHPHPLACPSNRSRRSLALYYYAKQGGEQRPKTVYRR